MVDQGVAVSNVVIALKCDTIINSNQLNGSWVTPPSADDILAQAAITGGSERSRVSVNI